MRSVLLVLALGVCASGQTMTEAAAAIAGTSVGSVAGKQVSSGVGGIFKKVGGTTAKAAETGNQTKAVQEPILQVGPGVPKEKPYNVPPPPPVKRQAKAAPAPVSARPAQPVLETLPEPLPPVPVVTRDSLAGLLPGTGRKDVLELGTPASRIMMFEDGHLVEIYRYQSSETTVGVVHLSDGAVSRVIVNP
jgi:hypothetical protein